ncbi:hypothetical protein APHAL10511_001554 [Amanita phalloides]|nr:hypothetical protein APHAL10511_001554 [Amanita phalloides]
MANTPTSDTVSGFTVLPVAYSTSSDSMHYLYVRRHASSESSNRRKRGAQSEKKEAHLPNGRSLFIVNMPPDATEREVVLFFKFCGTVERVVFDFTGGSELQGEESDSQDEDTSDMGNGPGEEEDGKEEQKRKQKKKKRKHQKGEDEVPKVVLLPGKNIRKLRKTGRTAHIVFLDVSSLDRLFSVAAPSKPRTWPTSEEPLGLSHYTAQYVALRPPLDAVKEHADSYIRVYDYELQKARHKSKFRAGEAIVDEDGFTLVARGGSYGRTLGGGVGVASKKFQQTHEASEKGARARRKAGEDKGGFYAFQKAEKQRSALIELKKKWEEDKAKIEKLKESRRFKPY